jgi:iron complex outermembrane receptor protein
MLLFSLLWLQSAAPGNGVQLEIQVFSKSEAARSAEQLALIPAGTEVVTPPKDRANLKLSDGLATSAGMVIQDFFGGHDQPRLQLRGSGLQQNPVERGVLYLANGLPMNRADGSYIVGLADPLRADFIEVNRGASANRLGATVLGGALNFVSPHGSSQQGLQLRLEGGSFAHACAGISYGWAKDGFDAHLAASGSDRQGFREINESSRWGANGNFGWRWNDSTASRLFLDTTDLNFDVAGPLPMDILQQDSTLNWRGPLVSPGNPPRYPGPNVHRDQPLRTVQQDRLGLRTTTALKEHQMLDWALGWSDTADEFRFPISSGVRSTDGGDSTLVARYSFGKGSTLPLFEITALAQQGSADRVYALNESGSSGAVFGRNRLKAKTISTHLAAHFPLRGPWYLAPSLSWSQASRENADLFTDARPTIAYNPAQADQRLPDGAVPFEDSSYRHRYQGFSPSLAISWRLGSHMAFAGLHRGFEPPTHDDLLTTVNGTPNSSPGRPNPGNPTLPAAAFKSSDLAEQTADTLELGYRLRQAKTAFELIVYHAQIRNELLSLRDESGAPLGAANADRTIHNGLELSLSCQLKSWLHTRIAYTWQDFHFLRDPLRGNRSLAGAPPQLLVADLNFQLPAQWSLLTRCTWRPEETPVDNMNTLYADSFAVFDLTLAGPLGKSMHTYLELRNVGDSTYAASTLIVDQARPDQAAFIPGEGRALYLGIKARL